MDGQNDKEIGRFCIGLNHSPGQLETLPVKVLAEEDQLPLLVQREVPVLTAVTWQLHHGNLPPEDREVSSPVFFRAVKVDWVLCDLGLCHHHELL